ncbi:MAG: hypothetical protein JW751_03380 [Polyangiaceae bacterium]|nr:hypothetical protein [Polyangiaceae bacterium]
MSSSGELRGRPWTECGQTDGPLTAGLVSESTVRHLFVQEGLDRVSLSSDAQQGKVRLRWAAERPGAL